MIKKMSIQDLEEVTPANTDWSHPLLQIQFKQLNSSNPPSINSLKSPVVWNGDVYALGRDHLNIGYLFKYSITLNWWSKILIPSEVYASYSVLVTYLSKLILISGQNRTIWELDCSCDIFKESCIEPVPGLKESFIATSENEYLIVAPSSYEEMDLVVHVFNGTSWSVRQYDIIERRTSNSIPRTYTTIIGNHSIFVVKFGMGADVESLSKAPLLLGECKDSLSILEWESTYVYVKESADERYQCYEGKRSMSLFNNNLFLADSQGVISTTFIQPPVGAVWIFVNSNISFRQAPHIVGLPNGELLMVGIVKQDPNDQFGCKSQLDVINIHHKVSEYDPYEHLTMRALMNLEWGMNIPVLTKLTPNLDILDKILVLKDDDPSCSNSPATSKVPLYYHITETIEYIRDWIDRKSYRSRYKTMIPPTWRNFIKILKDIPELSEVAYQIKDLFKATEADEDLSKLSADLISLQSSSNEKTIQRGLENSVKLCSQILQKVQQAQIEREQAVIQLLFKEKELTELKEEREVSKQAKEEGQIILKLTERDLPILLHQLKIHASKWREIGIHLGFLPGELDNIGASPNLSHSAPLSWFGAMLEDWLQWAPGDSRGSISFATLNSLKDALSEAGLGASARDLNLQNAQIDESQILGSSVQLLHVSEREATGIPKSILKPPRLNEPMSSDNDRSHASEEVVESNMLREPLLECSDDPQHIAGAPLPRLPSPGPEKKANQCLLQ